ncbi:MAG: hypothetical protein FJ011_25025 [Chloroflexi bacterium]|nr:hypothetical protein [Chloroflexota bacterium]
MNSKLAMNSLTGVWVVNVSPKDQPPFTSLVSFHSDGSMTANESDGRIGIGVWEEASDHAMPSRYGNTGRKESLSSRPR